MIALKTLGNLIETGLNGVAADSGIHYTIHTDAGEYKKAKKTRKGNQRYTNCLLRVVSSSVVPVQNLTVATQAVQLEVAVQLFDPNTDQEIINLHRGILDEYFRASSVQALTDEGGKEYTVSSQYSLANTGNVDQAGTLGSYLTFTVSVNYALIQNGLNSYDFKVSIDGVELGYSTVTITRVPSMDTGNYSDTNGAAKNIASATALNFDIKLPATTTENAANAAVFGFLFDGSMNTVHTLTLEMGNERHEYAVIFGQTSLALDGLQNAGQSFALIEAAPVVEEGYGG